MTEQKPSCCLRSFPGEPSVVEIASFRRSPGVDGYAVDAWGTFEVVEYMLYLLPVVEIIDVDVDAVADVVY